MRIVAFVTAATLRAVVEVNASVAALTSTSGATVSGMITSLLFARISAIDSVRISAGLICGAKTLFTLCQNYELSSLRNLRD